MEIILATENINFNAKVIEDLQYTYQISTFKVSQLEKALDIPREMQGQRLLVVSSDQYDYTKTVIEGMQDIHLVAHLNQKQPKLDGDKRITIKTVDELLLTIKLLSKRKDYDKIKYHKILKDIQDDGVFDKRQDKNIRKISNAINERSFFCVCGPKDTGKKFMAKKACIRSNSPFFIVNGKDPELEKTLFGYNREAGLIDDYNMTIIIDNSEYINTRILKKINIATTQKRFVRQGVTRYLKCSQLKTIFLITDMEKYTQAHAGYYKFTEESTVNILPVGKWRKTRLSLFIAAIVEKETSLDLRFTNDAKNILQKYTYKGNIEELIEIAHYIKRQFPEQPEFTTADVYRNMLPLYMTLKEKALQSIEVSDHPLREILDADTINLSDVERVCIIAAYRKNNFIKTRTAKELGISVSSLRERMIKYGIKEEKRI